MRSSKKALLRQRIKSVRLDLDIARPFLSYKELKELEDLYMDLHFQLWNVNKENVWLHSEKFWNPR